MIGYYCGIAYLDDPSFTADTARSSATTSHLRTKMPPQLALTRTSNSLLEVTLNDDCVYCMSAYPTRSADVLHIKRIAFLQRLSAPVPRASAQPT